MTLIAEISAEPVSASITWLNILFIIMSALVTTAAGHWLVCRFVDAAPQWVILAWLAAFLAIGGMAGSELYPIAMQAEGWQW
jgi:hypothetical protein